MPPLDRIPTFDTPPPPESDPIPGMTPDEIEAAVEATRLERQREREEVEAQQRAAAQAAADAETLVGDALHERARELDIDGRSTMTADQLRDAIAAIENAAAPGETAEPYVPPEPAPLELSTEEYAERLAQREDRLSKDAESTPEDAAQAQAEADAAR